MKRLLYILLCLPLWLACTDEHIPTSNHEVEEGTPVELRMSVALGEMNIASSRSLGDDISDYPTLWVVAFNKDGYLVEYAKAKDLKLVENGTLHETTFSVILHATSEPRILHFIAFGKEGEDDYELNLEYGHESNVIGSLVVDGGRDVYWHRKLLNDGIKTDPTYIANNFQRIPLLRNFAKITVSENLENFKLTGFYVLNVPTQGTVAPYSNGAFVNYMDPEKTETGKDYRTLNNDGYFGTMPGNVEYGQKGSSISSENSSSISWETGDFYMYENTYHGVEDKTTSILIRGQFSGSSTDTYYRADLTLPDVATGLSTYYHILRNFHYNLNITSVIAAGKKNPEDAITAAANNNLSGSVQVQNLSNISDGTAQLEVSYTDMVLVTTDKVTLKYRFLKAVGDSTSHANDRVKIYLPEGTVIDNYTVAESNETYKDANGATKTSSWRVITITPVGTLPAYRQEQKITLYDQETKLRREVTYTLRPKLDMVVNCTPKVESTAGESVVVNICIPDKLNENLFPLEFAIESQTSETSSSLKQYISPDQSEVMSVKTGGSIVTGYEGQRSYQYIKELTYEAYQKLAVVDGKRVFPVNFVTNTANSASTVYVDNKYFNKGSDFFVNTLPALVDTEYYGVGKDVFYMYEATVAGTYTLTATNATFGTSTESEIEVTLEADDIYETVLKTTTWSDHTSVTVGNSTKPGATTRNKLAMKAASTSGEGLVASTELHVYLSEDAAKAMTDASYGKFTNGTLTTSYNSIITANDLAEDTNVWFAYQNGGYIYYDSTTAGALANGTAQLEFTNRVEIPLEMSATLEGEQYYGTDKTVTLTLTTNKPGTYNVTFNEVNTVSANNPYSGTATIIVDEGATTGTETYITKDWSGTISATVTPATPLTGDPLTINGDTRNVLKITATVNNNNVANNINDNTTITIRSRNNNNQGTTFGTITGSQLKAGTGEITYSGLSSNTEMYFRFTYNYYYGNRTASAQISAENATGSGELTFNQQ